MDSVWREGPVKRFWDRLLNENVDRLVTDPEQFLLKHMRHDYAMVKDYQKRFGHIFEERGLNLYKLIAEACGEVWDDEDEQKQCFQPKKKPPMNKGNAVSLDHSRQGCLRQGEVEGDELPRRDGCREEDVQEKGGSGRTGGPPEGPT